MHEHVHRDEWEVAQPVVQEGGRRIGQWDFTDKEPRLKSWPGTIKGLARTTHNSNTIPRLLRRIMSLCIYFSGYSSCCFGDTMVLFYF